MALIAYGLEIREIEGARFGQAGPTPFRAPLSSDVVSSVTVENNQGKLVHPRGSPDVEWEKQITLTLAPHPKRENQEALREDLGLIDKPVKNVTTNAVTAGFVLIDLRVDRSPEGSLSPYEYHLRLMNLHEL